MGEGFAAHLIGWSDPLGRGLRDVAELGYSGCEALTDSVMIFKDHPQDLRRLLDGHDLRLAALYSGGRLGDPGLADLVLQRNLEVARVLSEVGTEWLVLGPAGPRDPAGTSDEALRQIAHALDETAERCRPMGVRVGIHPHLGTELQSRSEIDAVMAMTDADHVWLAPDVAHLYAAGMDPAAVIAAHARRVGYVHLKDVRPPGQSGPPFCELGLGAVDFGAVGAALQASHYSGWLTVEVDESTLGARESARVCREYLAANFLAR